MSGQHCENYDIKREQFTVTREMLTAVACNKRCPDVDAGISARFSKFALVLFGPLGFVSRNIEILGKQNLLFPSGSVIKC